MDLRSLNDSVIHTSRDRRSSTLSPEYRVGSPQSSGWTRSSAPAMTVVPLFGPDRGERFVPPLSGLKLARVAGYGNVELECRSDREDGVAIVPLHIGYIQDQAQNHALCGSALLGVGQKRMFNDACCVQQGQGGFLEGREQWFFVLPIALREAALQLRGKASYGKLWKDISALNHALGLPARGHLESIVCRDRYYLGQYANRFELCEGQTGALFFVEDRLVGVEIAPNARYFAEAWMPLVCFSYGVLAKSREGGAPPVRALEGSTLEAVGASLAQRRRARARALFAKLDELATLHDASEVLEEERYLGLRLSTITGPRFVGQIVEERVAGRKELVYLSLFATRKRLDEAA